MTGRPSWTERLNQQVKAGAAGVALAEAAGAVTVETASVEMPAWVRGVVDFEGTQAVAVSPVPDDPATWEGRALTANELDFVLDWVGPVAAKTHMRWWPEPGQGNPQATNIVERIKDRNGAVVGVVRATKIKDSEITRALLRCNHRPGGYRLMLACLEAPNERCERLVFDIDDHSEDGAHWSEVMQAMQAIAAVLAADGGKAEWVRSRRGKGVHGLVKISEVVTGGEVRAYGASVALRAGTDSMTNVTIELLPKGPNNLVPLPLARASERVDLDGGRIAAGPMNWIPVPAAKVREIVLTKSQGGGLPGPGSGGKPSPGDFVNYELPPDLEKISSALSWFVEHGDAQVGEVPKKISVGLGERDAWSRTGMAVAAEATRWPEHADALHEMFDRASERAAQVSSSTRCDPVTNEEQWQDWITRAREGKAEGGITLGTVYAGAKALGWQWTPPSAEVIPLVGRKAGKRRCEAGEGEAAGPALKVIEPGTREEVLAKMDQEFIFMKNQPRAPIVRITFDGDGDRHMVSMTQGQMAEMLENRWIPKESDRRGLNTGSEKAAKAWRERANRPEYERMGMYPIGQCPKNEYNLFLGFAVKPKQGEFPFIARLLHDVYCNGNMRLFVFLFKFLAWKFQHIGKLPEVALVLRGAQGTGKSTLIRDIIRPLLPHHTIGLVRTEDLTGKHNAQLRDKLFVGAHDAVFGADKELVGKLKAMITEPRISIEPKFVDAYPARNMMMLIIDSNEDWIVPVEPGDRRFCVLDVSSRYARVGEMQHPFWAKLHAALPAELPAFLWKLLNIDLTGFDPKSFPHTAARLDQQTRSLKAVWRWWLECLTAGTIVGAHGRQWEHHEDSVRQAWRPGDWPSSAPTHVFRQAYADWCRGMPGLRGTAVDEGQFTKLLHEASRSAAGPPLINKSKPRTGPRSSQVPTYALGSLDEHREAFARMLKTTVKQLF